VQYSEDPHKWPTYMVGMRAPDKVVGDVGVGQLVEFTGVTAGIRAHLNQRTAEYRKDPDGGAHRRSEFTGTYTGWISMDYKPEEGGTLVTQEMGYDSPGSVLDKVIDRLIIERIAVRSGLRSLESLKRLLETPSS